MSNFEKLIEKALSDDAFVQELVDNPEDSLRNIGIEPTEEILDALTGVDADAVRNLAQALGEDKAAI